MAVHVGGTRQFFGAAVRIGIVRRRSTAGAPGGGRLAGGFRLKNPGFLPISMELGGIHAGRGIGRQECSFFSATPS